jgi:hypothetical protein
VGIGTDWIYVTHSFSTQSTHAVTDMHELAHERMISVSAPRGLARRVGCRARGPGYRLCRVQYYHLVHFLKSTLLTHSQKYSFGGLGCCLCCVQYYHLVHILLKSTLLTHAQTSSFGGLGCCLLVAPVVVFAALSTIIWYTSSKVLYIWTLTSSQHSTYWLLSM